jgi:hypothetical protein
VKPAIVRLSAAAAAVLVLAGLRTAADPPPPAGEGVSMPAGIAAPPPLPPGPAPDLALIFSSQVVGWIEPCG